MMSQTLHIQLLGTFELRYGETLLADACPARLQSLLAYLLLHRDASQSRQHLAFLFWPDSTESQARTNLRNLLHRLRQTLPDGDRFLRVEGQAVQWQADAPFWLDAADFDRALAEAEEAAAAGDRAAIRVALERAAMLYQGDLLPGCYDDWILAERERLQRAFLDGLLRLACLLETEHEYGAAIECAQRLLRADPLHEPGYRALMRLHVLAGNRAGAMQVYGECTAALQRELGVEPEPETTALYERIRAGEELQPRSALAPHHLPTYLTPFLGREAYLSEIADRLADPECRLLTLVGPGGIGKTRLAVEAAREQVGRFADGVFYVPLAALPSVEAIVPTIAQAIGFSFYGGRDTRQQLLDHLQRKRMLLILDNYEHLLAGAGLATELLRAAPGVRIVVTTRARLNVRGEHLLPVGGLRCPETVPEAVSEADQYAAVQLFLAGARERQADLTPTLDDLAHAADICRTVQGMPLAILLAAAWAGMLSPAEIAAEIVQALDFLAADWRDAPERQRSMRAVFDHSYRLLSEREREVLQGLSVFRGGFTRQAAQQVTGASLRDLMALVGRSLLHRDAPSRGGRYEMHELLRQYAAEKLEQSSAAPGVRDRHCAYYVSVLEQFAAETKGPRQDAALAEMDRESENARAALEWAVVGDSERVLDRRHVEWLDRSMEGLSLYYDRRYHYLRGEAAFREAVQRLSSKEGPPGAKMRLWAKVLAWQALFLRQLGHPVPSQQPLRQALALLDAPELASQDTRAERAFVLFGIGWSNHLRDQTKASRCFNQGLALCRGLGDQWWAAGMLRGLQQTSKAEGDFEAGGRYGRESLDLHRALGDRWGIARAGRYLADNYALQGCAEEAERLARESFALAQDPGRTAHTAIQLMPLGIVLTWIGKYTEAHSALEQSVGLLTDQASLRSVLAEARVNLARIKIHLGEYEGAHAQVQEALALAQRIDHRNWAAFARLALGRLSLVDAAHARAREQIDDSVIAFREDGWRYQVREALASLAYAARGCGDGDQARRALYECLEPGDGKGSIWPVLYALPAAALLLLDQGETERAVELYALASRYAVVAHSRWFEDVAGRQINDAAVALPPDLAAGAQERGRARDLWATVRELLDAET